MTDGPLAPPQNVEAEREMLGAVLAYYSPRIIAEIKATGLQARDFYRFDHAVIYGTILDVDAAGEFVDVQTVSRALGPALDAAGGMVMLEFLLCHAVPHGVCERARIIVEDGRWRDRLGAAYEMIEACHLRDRETFEVAAGMVVSSMAETVPTLRAA